MKTLISDLGGVLVDFSHQRMCEQIAKVCELSAESVMKILFEQRSLQCSFGEQLERGDLTVEELHSYLSTFTRQSIDFQSLLYAACDIFSPNEGMINLLQQLKKRNVRLVLLSNTCEAHFEFVKNNFDFLNLFDAFILSYEIKARKPEKEIYLKALEAAQCSAAECLYIDDILEYVDAAKQIGIPSVRFTTTDQFIKHLTL